MRALIIAVVFFSILAFDLAANAGRLLGYVQGFPQTVRREKGF